MADHQPIEDNNNGQNSEGPRSSSTTQDDNTVTIPCGMTLTVPPDFFKDYDVKGSTFKLRTLDMNEEKIALKWVRKSHRCGFGTHIESLQNAAGVTSTLISSFRRHVDTKGWNIKVVTPLKGTDDDLEIGVEPFLGVLKRFNTNSFWECNAHRTYQKLIVAFSHFSYAASKGSYVLTNLQGAVDEKEKTVTLLSPDLVSDATARFGCKDVGAVKTFFDGHKCNYFCQDIPRPGGVNEDGRVFHFGQN